MVRPRSQHAHDKVLRAALDLFGERGIEATSMDAIAQSSGVSKATIYNHWANKEALLIEVMLLVNGLDREPPDLDSGDPCKDIGAVLARRPPDEFDVARNRLTPVLIAYSAINREFGDAWRHRVMEPARQSLKRILKRAIKRRMLPASLDIDLSMALLLGPLLYRHIFHDSSDGDSHDAGPAIAQAFWRAHALTGNTGAGESAGPDAIDEMGEMGKMDKAAFDRHQAANMYARVSNDGTRIAFWKQGSGPPLLLVHGGVCDHLAWRSVVPLLAQSFTVYAMDRRGRGGSGKGDTEDAPYAVEREVEDILMLLSEIGEPAHLLGHSAGAMLALAAAEHRSDLLSLMLYEPAYILDGARERPGADTQEQVRMLLAADDRDEVLRIAMRETLAIPDREIDMMRSGPGWEQLRSVAPAIPNDWKVWEQRFIPERLAGLYMPALVMAGSQSPAWLRAASQAVLAALPRARSIEMAGEGHLAMLTAPELFARKVEGFVESVAEQTV